MSEQWVIAIVTLLLSWLAIGVQRINGRLDNLVLRDDCSRDMGEHCDQIKDLRAKVQENSEQIATISAKVNAFHNNN